MHTNPITRRQFTRFAGALAASCLAVTACTPGTGGSGGDPAAEKPQTLRMLYATAEANAAAVQALLPQFKEKFGFELQMDTQPYEALQQKVFAEIASDSPFYDIIIVDTPWAPALVNSLEPLSGYINNAALNDIAAAEVGDFIPKVFYDTAVYNAEKAVLQYPVQDAQPDIGAITGEGFDVYGLPIQANANVMAYRKDLFEDPQEKAAFEKRYNRPLTVPATWDEFTEVAEFFTRPEQKLYGTTMMAGVGDWATDDFKTLLAGFGGNGRMIGDDLSLDFAGPEGEQALSYYQRLINDKVVPPGTTSASWDQTASSFNGGLAATSFNYHDLKLDTKVDGEVAYATVPEAVDRGPHFGTWMLSINKNSQNKAWAYRAIAWLTATEQQLAMTEDQLHPTRRSVYDALESADTPNNYYDALGESLAVGVGRPRLTNYTEISRAIAVAVNNAARGAASPRAALDKAADDVRRLLRQAGYDVPS
ncbi:MAG: ABC transporter substrate-binding protein [Haloechinothrix sp.]